MTHFLGLDIGTSTIKAALLDLDSGKVAQISTQPTPYHDPVPNWSEHLPDEIWDTVCFCIREAVRGYEPKGVGISSLAEAGVALDKEGTPLYPMIAWFDQRTEPQTKWIEYQLSHDEIHSITGQLVNSSFSMLKIKWLQDNVPGFSQKIIKWLSMPDFIHWKLTGGAAVTDYSVASRTLLFDQAQGIWSTKMLNFLNLTPNHFPEILASGKITGGLNKTAASLTGLPYGTPVVLGGHDHLCAAFTCGAVSPGIAIDSSGSSSSIIILQNNFLSNPEVVNRGYACYRYLTPDLFLLKAGLKTSGNAIQWLLQIMKNSPGESGLFLQMEENAKEFLGKTAGPIWLPHFLGSGTPEGDRSSLAAIVGLTIDHTQFDLYRGLLESFGFWCRQNLESMQELRSQKIERFILTGGLNSSNFLCELKASMVGLPATRLEIPESAAVGAALLAALGTGYLPDFSTAPACLDYPTSTFEPNPHWTKWYDEIYTTCYLPLYQSLRSVNMAIRDINAKQG